MRAGQLLQDLARLASGNSPLDPGWTSRVQTGGLIVWTASHIARV
jgi:hypothetical protein